MIKATWEIQRLIIKKKSFEDKKGKAVRNYKKGN